METTFEITGEWCNSEFAGICSADFELVVPYSPARRHGPPDSWEPAEGPEINVTSFEVLFLEFLQPKLNSQDKCRDLLELRRYILGDWRKQHEDLIYERCLKAVMP